MGLRELARAVGVSASLISQVELGKATPSVGTLYAIVTQLGMSMDELFFDASSREGRPGAPAAGVLNGAPSKGPVLGDPVELTDVPRSPPPPGEPVVRRGTGKTITLASGITWERLTARTEHGVEFLLIVYEVGAASCDSRSLTQHSGREYGYVLRGRLWVTVGFETYQLGPGDSIAFSSTMPHRLFNAGDVPAESVWFVVGRHVDGSALQHTAT